MWDRRNVLVATCVLLAAVSVALASEPESPAVAKATQVSDATIAPAEVRRHIETLADPAMEGRGTPRGKRLAAEYIRDEFVACGLKPLFGEAAYVQDIPGKKRDDGSRSVVGRNLAGVLPGSDPKLGEEIVIVSSHYDHLGIQGGNVYPGADDNASGVAMVLEIARQLSSAEHAPRRSVAFVCFDLEESMLWGSRWFAAHLPWPVERIKLFITADMIGRSLGDLPLPNVFVMGSEHARGLKDALLQTPLPAGLELSPLGADLVGTRSDYGPFRDRKIPFLFFSTGEHPDYHTPRDVPEKVDFAKAAAISSVILRLCRHVADMDQAPEWLNKPEIDLDEVRTLHRITELLLDPVRVDKLSQVQRLMVSHVHQKATEIEARGTLTPEDRGWLIRSAQLLLISVF